MKLKIILLIVLATLQLSAVSQKSVEFYVKRYMEKKMHSPVEKIETLSTYPIKGTQGWNVYFLSLKVNVKMGTVYRKKTVYQTVFGKGKRIAFSLKDKDGKEYSKILKPRVPQSAYDKRHLLVGNEDATHKILIMTDPFCPFCQEITPPIIDTVTKYPDTFALYYYHLPLLRIHPASDIVTKAMHYFHKQGNVKALKECYHLLVSERERNPQVILKAIKDRTGISLTEAMINTQEIKQALAYDNAMKKHLMVTGTPTIFLDGQWDPSRFMYKKYIPKNN